MRLPALVPLIASLVVSLPVLAQDGQLKVPDLRHLSDRAVESVNVTLGPSVLSLASQIMDMNTEDPDLAKVRQAFKEITSVTVRSYQFDTDVAPGADVEDVRRQLAAPGWTQLVQAHDGKKGEDVGVYLAYDDRVVRGLVILAVGPRELTLVHVAGRLEPSRVAELRRSFEK